MVYRRVYYKDVVKWGSAAGATGIAIFLLFSFLVAKGDIDITGYSNTDKCIGDELSPCIAIINFTAKKDIYIYPNESWTVFGTDQPLKEVKFQRSWGKGWRTIDLNSTWNKNVKYSIKFSANQAYTVRILGYKNSPFQNIKWSFGPLDPWWNTTWTQSMNFTVTERNGTSFTAMQVYMNISRSQLSHNVGANFEDFRLVDDNNNVMPCWNETYANPTGKEYMELWFKAPSLTASANKTYSIYYNVSGESGYCDDILGAAYEVGDEFNSWNSTMWNNNSITTGNFSIKDGYGILKVTNNQDYGEISSKTKFSNDVTLKWKGNATFGINGATGDEVQLGLNNKTGFIGTGSFGAQIISSSPETTNNVRYFVFNRSDGADQTISANVEIDDQTKQTKYEIHWGNTSKVEFRYNNSFNYSINTNVPNTPANASFLVGRTTAGLSLRNATLDWVFARKYALQQPYVELSGVPQEVESSGVAAIFFNGSANNTYETGEGMNITGRQTGSTCLYSNNSYIGNGINCGTNKVVLNISANNGINTFNDTNKTKNLTFSGLGNQNVWISNLNRNDTITGFTANFSGYTSSGTNPKNVSIDIGNDGTIDNYLIGNLSNNLTAFEFNDSRNTKNFTFVGRETKRDFIRVNTFGNSTNAYLNITGFAGGSQLVLNGQTREMCGNYTYDLVDIRNGSKITICPYNGNSTSGYLRFIVTTNISIDSTSGIEGYERGYRGATACNSNGESFDGTPGIGGGRGGSASGGYQGGGGGGGAFGNYSGSGSGGGTAIGGANGTAYGNSTNYTSFMGSGGGGGGFGGPGCAAGGQGGNGGGYVFINSSIINVFGYINVSGGNGSTSSDVQGGGGGGSGGEILLVGGTISINSGLLKSTGGNGATSSGGCGGSGSGGRVKIFWNSSFSNTTSVINFTKGSGGAGCPAGGSGVEGGNGRVMYNQTTYDDMNTTLISNPSITIGFASTASWNYSGIFNWTRTTSNFSSEVNSYVTSNCQNLKYCDVPIDIYSDSGGTLNLNTINITYNVSKIALNYTAINTYLKSSPTLYNATPLNISSFSAGIFQIGGLNLTYFGSGTYNVTLKNTTNQIEGNFTVIYSNYSARLPYNDTNDYFFFAENFSSRNVTPFGQTNNTPIFNVTGRAYDRNMTVGISLTQAVNSCVNITYSNASNISQGTTFITSYTNYSTIRTNLGSNQSFGIWMWLDLYDCNPETFLFMPNVTIRACCVGCLKCW